MAEIRVLADKTRTADLYSSSAEELERVLATALGERDNSAIQAFISIYGENPPPRQYPQELPIEITLREIFRRQLRNDRVFIMPILAPIAAKSGGASIKMFRPTIGKKLVVDSNERKDAISHAVSVTFDRIVVCVREGRILYVDPSQTVSVIGLRVLPMCGGQNLGPDWPPSRDMPDEVLDCDIDIFRAVRIAGAVITGKRDMYLREGSDIFMSTLRQLFSIYTAACAAGQVVRAACDFASANYTELNTKGGTIANHYMNLLREQPHLHLDAGFPAENSVPSSPFTKFIDGKIHEFNRAYAGSFYSQLDMYELLSAYFLAGSRGVDDDDVRALVDASIEREAKRKEQAVDAANRLADRSRLASYLRILQKRLTSKRYNQLPKDSITSLLRSLNKAELSQMEHEYSVEQQYAEAVLNNNCKHVGLYRRLRRAMDNKLQKDILRNLQANYFDKAKGGMISCRVCKFNIMCPHLVTVIENSDKPIGQLRSMLNRYLSQDSTRHQQYCNICGEVLFAAYDLHDDVISQVEQDDDLRRAVWAEISNVLRNVHFEKTVDINRLTANIRDSIYEIASGISARVDKIQSYSINEIAQRKSLYLSILAMAKVLQIMRQYPTMKFRDIGGKSTVSSDLITTAANLIYITKIVAIREIPGVTKDSIKDILRQTSALLLPEKTKLTDRATEPEKDYYMLVYYDPTYHWLARANKLPASAFDKIMGGPVAQLVKQHHEWIYSSAKIPRRAFDDPAEEKAFQLWMKVATGGGPELYARVGEMVTRSPEFITYNEQWAEIAALEKKARANAIMGAMRCWSQVGVKGENKFTRREVKLGELYDENGLPHKWDIYVVGRNEYTKAEILQKPDAVITDRLCGVCRVKESQAAKLDERRIETAIDLRNAVSGFFKFYDRRCPEGDTHTWDKSGFVCAKCELDLRWDGDARTGYYLRYKDAYAAEKSKLIDMQIAPVMTSAPVKESTAPPDKKPINWKENFQFVTDLAKVSGVSVGQIQSIGAYEGVDLEDIISGKYVPTVTENKNNTRPAHVRSVVEATLITWEKVRNYTSLRSKNEYLTMLINGYNRSELSKLPSILHGFSALYTAFKANEDPERTITMCIQEWCERLLKIYNLDDPPSEHLRRQFVVSQVVSVVDLESLLTKREAFNWSIVYGTKTSASEADLNDEFIGEEGEKFDDPFSMDGFDVEDPGEINLRAGSDYGLD